MTKRFMTVISLSVLLAGGTVATSAYALSSTYTPTKVGCFDNGTCYIVVSPEVPSTHSNCGDKTQVRWKLPGATGGVAGGAEMLRTALTAMMAGRTLDINTYHNNSSACIDGYPQVSYLNAN